MRWFCEESSFSWQGYIGDKQTEAGLPKVNEFASRLRYDSAGYYLDRPVGRT